MNDAIFYIPLVSLKISTRLHKSVRKFYISVKNCSGFVWLRRLFSHGKECCRFYSVLEKICSFFGSCNVSNCYNVIDIQFFFLVESAAKIIRKEEKKKV